jgi:hypothetical protein
LVHETSVPAFTVSVSGAYLKSEMSTFVAPRDAGCDAALAAERRRRSAGGAADPYRRRPRRL